MAGGTGGQTAQKHFLESVSFRKLQILPQERAKLTLKRWGAKGDKFDDKGDLKDEEEKKQLKPFLDEFSKWIKEKSKKC